MRGASLERPRTDERGHRGDVCREGEEKRTEPQETLTPRGKPGKRLRHRPRDEEEDQGQVLRALEGKRPHGDCS